MGTGPFWPALPPGPTLCQPGPSDARCGRAAWDLCTGRGLLLAGGRFLSLADIDQLKRIMEVVGTPSPEVLAKISSEHVSQQPPEPP